MDTTELMDLKKRIGQLSEKLERLESAAFCVTATISEFRGGGSISEGVEKNAAEISDVKTELHGLQAEWDNAIGRLSYDDDTANCIYLHYAAGYTWQQIANLTDGIPDTAAGIRMRCRRYRW